MPPKPRKEEFEAEDPWRYMAALPLGHVLTMRRYVTSISSLLVPRLIYLIDWGWYCRISLINLLILLFSTVS